MADVLNAKNQAVQCCKLLLVEDNPGDVRLLREALLESNFPVKVSVAGDGQKALDVLEFPDVGGNAERPDLILLDLNLPLRSGHEVLAELKNNPITRQIPVIIFSTSESKNDIFESYQNHANCYISKPADLDDYMSVTGKIFDFWLRQVKIPGKNHDLYDR